MGYSPLVYAKSSQNEDDFIMENIGDITIHKVNLSRATFREAQTFKDILLDDNLSDNLKVIIDLSSCEYIDSTFLGSLVVVLKKITERGGEIKYVAPKSEALHLFKLTGLYGVLNLYHSREDAIDSFVYLPLDSLK